MTLRDWYETKSSVKKVRPKLNNIIDEDLRRLFTAKRGRSAADILQANQSLLIREVNYWTGLDRHILTSLFIELLEEVSQLDLKIESKQTTVGLASISIFLATLATNYQISGQFMAE